MTLEELNRLIDLTAERLAELKRMRKSLATTARNRLRFSMGQRARGGRPRLPLTDEQRRVYEKLRTHGVERSAALAEVRRS